MQLRPRAGYPLLALLLTVVYLPFTLHFTLQPTHRYGKCVTWIGGPTPVIACEDGHSYQIQGKDKIDMGQMSIPGAVPMG